MSAAQARSFGEEFFPTPAKVIAKMIAKLKDTSEIGYVLEPSAGKGAIAEAVRGECRHGFYDRSAFCGNTKIDCIEQDFDLVKILQGKDFPVVGFDWLTYDGVCYYDAILMNPPFSNGAAHLLKAWEFMHDGQIVCLLNEETLKNAYTEDRKRLARIVAEHGEWEPLGDCFARGAERGTGVRVALVYLLKTAADDSVDVWHTAGKEKEQNFESPEEQMLAVRDELGNLEHHYNMAIAEMLQAHIHARRSSVYMKALGIGSYDSHERDYKESLATSLKNINSARAEFVPRLRKDAWKSVFDKMQFHKWLDHKQTEELSRDVERNSSIPFTAENIKGTLENVMLNRHKLFDQSMANVFDELTRYAKENTNGAEGWKSNENYKVNMRLVFPWAVSYCNVLGFSFRYTSGRVDIFADLDRVLCAIEGVRFEEIATIGGTLDRHWRSFDKKRPGVTKSSFFKIRWFKKGTIHLYFLDPKVHQRFNIACAKGKKWVGANTKGESKPNDDQ